MPNALYICYFGIREPLVQTQVLPYLRELLKIEGLRMSLLTFEPKSKVAELRSSGGAELRLALAEQGIDWHWLRYHKRPSTIATAWDVFRGGFFAWRFIGREKTDLLHARVHIPMLMAALARKFSRRKPKILFDIRGFMPEEYTDAGIWPEGGLLYRTVKRVERWLMNEADGFVVLTEKARSILFPDSKETGSDKLGRPVEVIPCCIDPNRFNFGMSRVEARRRLNVEDRFVVAYVGSFGGWYMTDEIMDLFVTARTYDPRTFVLILTQRDPEKAINLLRNNGFAESDFLVASVEPARLPDHLLAADVAVSFIKPCYSKLSSSPTKIAEYLGCGVPIIANSGVGDLDELIDSNRIGAVVREHTPQAYTEALSRISITDGIRDRCLTTATAKFDLATGAGPKYRLLYNKMIGKDVQKN